VPGHFHIYLLLGEVAMSFGFMAYLIKEAKSSEFQMIDKTAFGVYLAGGIGFTLMFLVSGAMSVPRRWAVHAEEWMLQDRIATAFALLVIVGALIFVVRYIIGIATYRRT
jgi:cytochrome c oxidase subunit 1